MATPREIDDFLRGAQRRAFKMALFAIREEQAALDAIQDSMIKLCENYAGRPASELPALFGRIVQNRIHDHFRKNKTLSKINILHDDFSSPEADGFDFAEALSLESGQSDAESTSPETLLDRSRTLSAIEEALAELPERQREAFLLRHWEGLDTHEAAKAMGVTAGSVKTHLSRATHALAAFLKGRGIRL